MKFCLASISIYILAEPGRHNELGSWITYQLIQTCHQYGMDSRPAL